MNRLCVIDIAGASCDLVARDRELWINRLPFGPRPMHPTFPALAPCVQASMTTGCEAGKHGIVSGGLYRRESHTLSFDERSNTLLAAKRFWHRHELPRRPTVALVNWANPLAGAADVALGASTYGPSCLELCGQPMNLINELGEQVGAFASDHVRGPLASWTAGVFWTSAAEEIWRRHRVDMLWVQLPGVDFEIVRHGLDSPQVFEALRVLDLLARRLASAVAADGGQTIVLSDGGYLSVHRAAMPNLLLRKAGLLQLVEGSMGPVVDLENSRAFAMTDHQVAHLFCADKGAAKEAEAVVAADPAVAKVLCRDDVFCDGAGRFRSGERIAVAAADAWFTYRWWEEDVPPLLARRGQMQGKCGYDPCELIPGEAAGWIDANCANVRASRGRVDEPASCLLAATCDLPSCSGPLRATDLPRVLTEAMFGHAV